MTLNERDKKILVILLPLVVVLAYWFLLLAPKREAASTAAATLETEKAALAEAETQASTVSAAKANFARDYAAVVALGKAIPSSVDMPSLLVQLEQAARGTGIALDGVTAGEREAVAGAAPTGTAAPGAPNPGSSTPTAPSGQPPQSAPGTAAANAQSAADSASAGSTASDPSAAGSATTDPAAAGTAPALESVSLEFKFTGDFFSLADFFHRLKRFVYVEGDNVRVRGRLMTVDGVEYTADADTFPSLSATVQATVYLSPKAEGVTAGATPAGPQPASATTAPPAATASTGTSSPTPTATATP